MRRTLRLPWLVLSVLALVARPDAAAADGAGALPSAAQLLADSDRARGGIGGGITWNIELDTAEGGEKTHKSFIVKARGNDALVETTAPASQKGEIMLFNDRTIWYFKAGLRKPVSISARQRLSGQAANGDIASTNYARDYEGTVVGVEKIGGVEAAKLELKAKAKNVTYDRIRYWVSLRDRVALQAEFLTIQGDVMKSARFEYSNTFKVDGKDVPFVSGMTITDAQAPDNVTALRYSAPRLGEHPTSLFNINNVVR